MSDFKTHFRTLRPWPKCKKKPKIFEFGSITRSRQVPAFLLLVLLVKIKRFDEFSFFDPFRVYYAKNVPNSWFASSLGKFEAKKWQILPSWFFVLYRGHEKIVLHGAIWRLKIEPKLMHFLDFWAKVFQISSAISYLRKMSKIREL